MPLKRGTPSLSAPWSSRSLVPHEYHYGSVEENKTVLMHFFERTEFTLILIRMVAGDVFLGSRAISTDRHS